MKHHPESLPHCLAAAPTNRYRKYRPRRAAARWLEGAPDHVLDVLRTCFGGYTVLYFLPKWEEVCGREMSARPHHPQGVGIWFSLQFHEAAAYRSREGRRRMKWADLPADVKQAAAADGEGYSR